VAEVTLDFIGKQLERVLAEQAAIRDEFLVLGARVDRVEAGISLVLAEVKALTNEIYRMNTRITRLEARESA
jgi:hypothetical protein